MVLEKHSGMRDQGPRKPLTLICPPANVASGSNVPGEMR